MNFNNSNDDVVVVSSVKPLMPFAVHTVTFDGIEIQDGGTWKLMKLNFSNNDGNLKLSVFRPNERDEERRENKRANGTAWYTPSNAENLWACMRQLMNTLNPEGYEKAKSVKIKNFDDAFTIVEKVLKGAVGKETNIKVEGYMKNGYITYRLPNITMLANSSDIKSECKQSDYFVGEKVFLSNYNMTQKAKFMKDFEASRNAAPTPMESVVTPSSNIEGSVDAVVDLTAPSAGSEDIDLANLDL